MVSTNVFDKDLKTRAFLSWDMDLEQIEKSLGIVDPVNTLPVKMDPRVPPQGSVLWNRIAYLPPEQR